MKGEDKFIKEDSRLWPRPRKRARGGCMPDLRKSARAVEEIYQTARSEISKRKFSVNEQQFFWQFYNLVDEHINEELGGYEKMWKEGTWKEGSNEESILAMPGKLSEIAGRIDVKKTPLARVKHIFAEAWDVYNQNYPQTPLSDDFLEWANRTVDRIAKEFQIPKKSECFRLLYIEFVSGQVCSWILDTPRLFQRYHDDEPRRRAKSVFGGWGKKFMYHR